MHSPFWSVKVISVPFTCCNYAAQDHTTVFNNAIVVSVHSSSNRTNKGSGFDPQTCPECNVG